MIVSVATGALLGLVCIVGIGYRLGYSGNELFLLSAFLNRILMGFVIGVFGKTKNPMRRGAVIGLLISGLWYVDTGLRDTPGFFAGIVYGMIIDYVATRYGK